MMSTAFTGHARRWSPPARRGSIAHIVIPAFR